MNNNQGSPFSGTMFLNKAVISGVTGATAKTISTTPVGTSAAMEYAIKGKAYTHAAMSGHALPTTDVLTGAAFPALAANQGCVVVLALAANGDLVCAQSNICTLSGGSFQSAPEFPSIGENYAPFGYIVCANGATGGAWTFATSNWDATGMTATPVDVIMLPGRPQVS